MQSDMDSALQDYADFLKAEYVSRGASWAKSGFDRQLVVEFDKGSKFIKVIIGYSTDGVRDSDPEPVNRSTMFIDKFVASSNRMTGISISFSHLEVLTETGLLDMCKRFLSGSLVHRAFSQEGISAAFHEEH